MHRLVLMFKNIARADRATSSRQARWNGRGSARATCLGSKCFEAKFGEIRKSLKEWLLR